MIEENPFIDDKASMMPDKGGAVVKSTARPDGSRIANAVDVDALIKNICNVVDSGFQMGSQIVASKNGTATTTPTVMVQKKDNSVVWVVVGLVAVALVVGLLFFMKKRK